MYSKQFVASIQNLLNCSRTEAELHRKTFLKKQKMSILPEYELELQFIHSKLEYEYMMALQFEDEDRFFRDKYNQFLRSSTEILYKPIKKVADSSFQTNVWLKEGF